MDSGHHVRSQGGFNKFSALFGYAKLWPEQGLSCSRAEGHNHLRLDHLKLGLEPGTASRNFLKPCIGTVSRYGRAPCIMSDARTTLCPASKKLIRSAPS